MSTLFVCAQLLTYPTSGLYLWIIFINSVQIIIPIVHLTCFLLHLNHSLYTHLGSSLWHSFHHSQLLIKITNNISDCTYIFYLVPPTEIHLVLLTIEVCSCWLFMDPAGLMLCSSQASGSRFWNKLTFQVTLLQMTRHPLHLYVGVAA